MRQYLKYRVQIYWWLAIQMVFGACFLISSFANALEKSPGKSPLAGAGLHDRKAIIDKASWDEMHDLASMVQSFEASAEEYRQDTVDLIRYKYQKKRDQIFRYYEDQIEALEQEQRTTRMAAIETFQTFVEHYPADNTYTPDAMFRLSELYFERSYDNYFQQRQVFEQDIDAWDPGSSMAEPEEPVLHYEDTIGMMQRLIVSFPNYRLIDGAHYLLGYCLGEQGEEERAVNAYQDLLMARPKSAFAAEVWMRIGEYHFNTNALEDAKDSFTQVLAYPNSPFYDRSLYKLAWTYYRLADPDDSPEQFQQAVDTFITLLDFNAQTKAAGKERGKELRGEAIQYVAICYAEEGWGTPEKLISYLDAKGGTPYDRELLTALGDIYFDQTKFDEAVQMYALVQARFALDSEAPKIQQKIISAHERNREFDAATLARDQLNELYASGSDWYHTHQGDSQALEAADKLTKDSLYSAALFHHRQAQVHKESQSFELATESYGKAASAYGDYINRFPHDKQIYELTYNYADTLYYSMQFSAAAENYIAVRDAVNQEEYREDAAFSAILAYNREVESQMELGKLTLLSVRTSAERDPDDTLDPKKIPKLSLQAIVAADRYWDLFGADNKNEKLAKILYKSAETYFAYDHLAEARRRFIRLLEWVPDSEVSEFAANWVIESHFLEQNFTAVEAFADQLLNAKNGPKDEKFRESLRRFRSGAQFKHAEALNDAGEFDPAAELYLKLVKEDPKSEFAAMALNNAAVSFEKYSRFDSASKLYARIAKEYPESPFADNALFRVGVNAERFFNFDNAIDSYLNLIANYKDSAQRPDAIYNAASGLENMQQYERAATQYRRYCQLYPDREDAPAVCFRAGVVYEKMGEPKRVIKTFQKFVKTYRKNKEHADRVMEANLRIAKAYGTLHKSRDQKRYFKRIVTDYAANPDPQSSAYAAESQFFLVDQSFDSFKKLRFEGKSKKQQKMLTKKAKRLKEIEKQYTDIVRFKQFDWTLAAFYRIGQLYQDFAESLIEAACPPDVKRAARRMGVPSEEVCDEYKVLLEEKAATLEDKAVERYEVAVNKGREFQVANRWTKATLVALNSLRRQQWPLQKDAKSFLDANAIDIPALRNAQGEPLAPITIDPANPAPNNEVASELSIDKSAIPVMESPSSEDVIPTSDILAQPQEKELQPESVSPAALSVPSVVLPPPPPPPPPAP